MQIIGVRKIESFSELEHSECYTKYGLKRTGCAGCPFNPNLFDELKQVQEFERGLLQVAQFIFNDSYNYTRLYQQFI